MSKGSWTTTATATGWSAGTIWIRVNFRIEPPPPQLERPVLSPDQRRHLRKLYRAAAKRHHPDLGGSDVLMAQVNEALANEDLVEMERLATGP